MLSSNHFYDSDENSLEMYEDIWNGLHDFYGKHLPGKIIIKRACQDGSSTFEPEEKYLTIDCSRDEDLRHIIAHEGSHIALYYMTNRASNKESFRFLDEGWASVIAERIAGNLEKHKQKALYKTCIEKKNGKTTIDILQSWSVYFGNWSGSSKNHERNFDAYFTGASVIYYILDNYEEGTLKKLFIDIGNTQDLKTSIQSVLGIDVASFEKAWLAYLDNHCKQLLNSPANMPAKAMFMSPNNGSNDVDPKIDELIVKFNVPMDNEICILTDCKEICYKNAYWKDDKTLIVKLPNGLAPGKNYTLSLGSEQCRLKTFFGENIPIINWHFSTK